MIQETKTKWNSVYNIFQKDKGKQPLKFGEQKSEWFYDAPTKLISCLAYYKFAAKMIGTNKKVLDIGCEEGIGSYLIAKECGACCGIDTNEDAIDLAKSNYQDSSVEFHIAKWIDAKKWDAIIQFSEQKYSFKTIAKALNQDGIALIGTAALEDDFEMNLENHFDFVFPFSVNNAVVQTGFDLKAHYFIALCCSPK